MKETSLINFYGIEFQPSPITAGPIFILEKAKSIARSLATEAGLLVMKGRNSYGTQDVNLTKILIWTIVSGVILASFITIGILAFLLGELRAENRFYRQKVDQAVERQKQETAAEERADRNIRKVQELQQKGDLK